MYHSVCISCETEDSKEISSIGRQGLNIRTVTCKKCGLVYTNPRLDSDENDMFYQHFYKIFFRGEDTPSERHLSNQEKKAKACINDLKQNNIDMSSINSVLDVGCSAGGMLKYFRDVGVEKTIGIEPSINFAEYARNNLDLDVYTTTLEEYLEENSGQKFDLVIMRDVVEHLLDPRQALQDVRKILHKDSILFIETNNVFKSLNPTLKYNYQFHYSHPYIFSENTLTRVLGQTGFKTIFTRDNRYLTAIAKFTTEDQLDLPHDDYKAVLRHIKNHDKFLWFTNIIFKLRVTIAKLRGKS